ncbi:hypothetical protein DPMN_182464 [Dreissena polymorpha]|uniref:Uncharacterized protein n=1 Tax=Dreissena polymorpha TaxID=45954 RepID=A0A9D4DH77_DREPO|nr:hypothetical protein DPMN_182464 [Dreissena polymorpha]
MADLAVLRGKCLIQNTEQLCDYGIKNLQSPKSGVKRRVFKYLETIIRDTEIRFDPVDEIRSVHHVRVHGDEPGVVHVKAMACFSCEQCIIGM